MKITLDTSRVRSALKYVKLYVGKTKKSTTSAYTGVELYINNKILTFVAFNGDNGIKFVYGEVEGDNINRTIEFDLLSNLISNISTDAFSLVFEEDRVRLTAGKSKYSLKNILSTYLPAFDVIPVSITKQAPYLTITVDALTTMQDNLFAYLSKDVNAAFLCGVYYDGNFVTNNNVVMGVFNYGPNIDAPILTARSTYDTLCSFPIKDREIKFYTCDNVIYYTSIGSDGEISAFTRSLIGKYPNYKTVVTRTAEHTSCATISSAEFISACNRLAPFTETDDNQKVEFKFENDTLTLSSTSRENTREGTEELKVETPGVDVATFMFNLKFISTIVKTATSDSIDIYYTPDSSLPLRFHVAHNVDAYCTALKYKATVKV